LRVRVHHHHRLSLLIFRLEVKMTAAKAANARLPAYVLAKCCHKFLAPTGQTCKPGGGPSDPGFASAGKQCALPNGRGQRRKNKANSVRLSGPKKDGKYSPAVGCGLPPATCLAKLANDLPEISNVKK